MSEAVEKKVVDAPPAPPTELKEMIGVALLDVLDARKKSSNRTSVTRLLYVATFAEGLSAQDVQAAHEKIWFDLDSSEAEGFFAGDPDMQLTGIAMAHDRSLVHAFECKCEKAVEFMVALQAEQCLDGLRVLIQSEDCPKRLFDAWKFEHVSAKREEYEVDQNVDASDLAWDVYTTVLKMVEVQRKRGGANIMDCAASDLVPSQGKISAYVRSDNWLSLEEYCEFFAAPLFVELESEKVWPVQKFEKLTGYLNNIQAP
ncbi:hypothetical protein M885DRAFT_512111 [Pelagophyceae sp. CCMP2097]|nr:hypothetical protein M885DRAFT_512111 [Pelagophyceae sp. CCMP2097]|mmetsp:Transcript_3087/g.9286  ORF Transcript_3087/g.9286 Transcript_3087/m.9286 type:complete len:258 (+) Transcript_3087:58-831(+)